MRWCVCVILVLGVAWAGGSVQAQSTQPAPSDEMLEFRATQAFDSSEYAVALPLLQKLAGNLKDQPDRLGRIEEMIRVCEASIKTASAANGQPVSAVDGLKSAESRKAHVRPPGGEVLELDIKSLGNFDYDSRKGGNIPTDVLALNGVRFRTTGFMIPLNQTEKITHFALVPSLLACCYGQPPQLQHTIVVHCPKGKTVAYYPDELMVEGELKVEEKKDGPYVISVFELNATSVRPAAK